jgi:hypothetical protein
MMFHRNKAAQVSVARPCEIGKSPSAKKGGITGFLPLIDPITVLLTE